MAKSDRKNSDTSSSLRKIDPLAELNALTEPGKRVVEQELEYRLWKRDRALEEAELRHAIWDALHFALIAESNEYFRLWATKLVDLGTILSRHGISEILSTQFEMLNDDPWWKAADTILSLAIESKTDLVTAALIRIDDSGNDHRLRDVFHRLDHLLWREYHRRRNEVACERFPLLAARFADREHLSATLPIAGAAVPEGENIVDPRLAVEPDPPNEPWLGTRPSDVLIALFDGGHIGSTNKTTRKVLAQAINRNWNETHVARSFRELKEHGYTDSAVGPDGAVWLTATGKLRAMKIKLEMKQS